jgi:hypothetical protein
MAAVEYSLWKEAERRGTASASIIIMNIVMEWS